MRVKELVKFISERQAIYVRRQGGVAKPWTKDPILQRYRFCNVYREQDAVTQQISNMLRTPAQHQQDMWFLMAAARWVNWPNTLSDCVNLLAFGSDFRKKIEWHPKRFMRALNERKERGDKVWTGAYMIGTQGNNLDKPKFIAEMVLSPMWKNREMLRPREGDSLHQFASRLSSQYAMAGGFMTGQVVADVKNASVGYLSFADERQHSLGPPDWYYWAVSGPGSRRGMQRVMSRDIYSKVPEAQWKDELDTLRHDVNMVLSDGHQLPVLCAQDLQNCLCEFDKYERVRLGEGKPRSRYPGV